MQQQGNKTKYLFQLEQSPNKKGDCPNCKKQNCFRHYNLLPKEYGICDHINKCDYHKKPSNENEEIKKELYKMVNNTANKLAPIQTKKTVVPTPEQLNVLSNYSSSFHKFCVDFLKITREHLLRWNVGTNAQGNTVFILQDITGKHLNIKFIEYVTANNNCKRNKNKNPYYLKAKETEQYKKCLFGEHLINKTNITCIVESEKTAVICAFFYPQYNWIATGGNNGVKVETLTILKGLEVYYLADNDKAGNDNSILTKLQNSGIEFKKVFFETAKDSEDLADIIIRGERPEIKPTESVATTEQQQETTFVATEQKSKSKNISEYEKVENFINERYEIRNNVVSNKIEYRTINEENKEFNELNEHNIFRELQKNFIPFSINKLKSLLGSEFVKEYNPFINYFENLPKYNPESDTDYILNLTNYIPVKDKQRLEVQFKKMLVRCIACSIDNVVNKQAFVLVHDQQNSGKTTFLRWLNPPELKNYIAENINTDKDSLIAMCTNFFINMDELATLNRSEINALKSVMSKDVFKGRLPYGAREVSLIRRANIVGSTNNIEFLNDETGSVRWLCFELTDKLNFDYKKDFDINKIWAQAYYLLRNGFKYELTPQEIAENEVANANHRIITVEQELIQASFEPSNKNEIGSIFKTVAHIKLMLNEKYNSEKLNPTVIGKALKILGFIRVSERPPDNDYSVKGYYLKQKNNY